MPSDPDRFRLTDFGAAADGHDAQFLATWETGAPRLQLCATICGVAIAAGSAELRLEGLGTDAGRLFAFADVGLPIHIPQAGPGAGLTTRIARVRDAHNVLLADPAQQTVAGAPGRVTWPCFLPEDAGKMLWIEGGSHFHPPGAHRQNVNHGLPLPLQARIAVVHGPGEVTLGHALTAPGGAGIPQRVVWGTDDTAALLCAGEAAIAAGAGDLAFPRGLVCAFGCVQDAGGAAPPCPGIGQVFGLLRWIGDDADSFVTDTAGNVLFLRPSPRTPRPFAQPARGVAGRVHLPRLAAARRPVIVVAGDSMSTAEVWNGTPHSAASSPLGALIEAIQLANPAKPCWFVDRSFGGATWERLDGRPHAHRFWYTDAAKPWLDYVRHVPGEDDAEVAPDLVVLAIGGGNDGASVSLSALELVIAKVAEFPPDAAGRPPDILLLNARPGARWGLSDALGTPDGQLWNIQAGREVPGLLHRSFAALRGIGLLDYEDVAQRVLWGWSFSRSALRRVPDTDAQECRRTAPLSLRRRCRDFSFYLTLPGPSGAAAWQRVGALAVQIGSRPDNVAVIGTDAAGRLTLQVNAWGGTTTAMVGLREGGTILETGSGQSTRDTLRWQMQAGSNAVLAQDGPWPFSAADIGKSILVPGARHAGAALRSSIVAVGTSPDRLYLADAAAINVPPSTHPLRWGGQFFVPSDAAARVDVVLPGAGPDGGDMQARVAACLGPNRVALDRPLAVPGRRMRPVFVGRIALPRRTLPVAMDASPDPRLHVYVKGTQLFVGLLTAETGTPAQAYRGPCLRYGGAFLPQITPATDRPVWLRATHCYIDEPIVEGQVLTDAEMWGMWDRHFSGPWDGNGFNHLTHRQFSTVDVPLLRAQDFAAG